MPPKTGEEPIYKIIFRARCQLSGHETQNALYVIRHESEKESRGIAGSGSEEVSGGPRAFCGSPF